MVLGLIRQNNITAPAIICDKCKKPIEKASDGLVNWTEQEIGNISDFKITHNICGEKHPNKSMNLSHYFWSLDKNCQRDIKTEKERAEFSKLI